MDQATEGSKPAKAKPEVAIIQMSDGRSVEFVGKRKLLKSPIIEGQQVAVRLDFRNGETRTFQLPDALLLQFAAHGAEQKLGDETAGEDDVDDMVLSVDDLIERLNKGEWRTQREAGNSMAGTSVLLQALVEASGKTIEEVKAFLKDKKPADKAAMRNSEKLRPIVQRIENAKAAKNSKVDTAQLLGEIGI